MRKFLLMFAFFAGIGLIGPTAKEAAAQCTHLGSQGTCPVGIPNGSNSVSFNANGTINWNTGGISGPCCAAPSGTETGSGLLNLNNQLGGTGPGPGNFPIDNLDGDQLPRGGGVNVAPPGSPPVTFFPGDCGPGGCTQGVAGEIFGANPNSGYLCDSGGAGCGNDLWTSTPQTGFGECGPGGCTGSAPIQPINFGSVPRTSPYALNRSTGQIDPFGGGSSFQDPITGEAISISDDPRKWPDHVRHADDLNTAYVNGEITYYPFSDPDWRNRSVEDFVNEPPPLLDNRSRPLNPYSVGDSTRAEVESDSTTPTEPRPERSNKPGRFGIGADTSLGGVNGLSARFQVAKNFGIQAVVSYIRTDSNPDKPNADLTNYVSDVIVSTEQGTRPTNFVSVLPAVTPAPAPASTPPDEDADEPPEPRSESTNLRIGGWNSLTGIDRVDTEGQPTVFRVTTTDGRVLDFKSREDAFFFSNRWNSAGSGKTYNEVVGELPSDRGPINVGPVNTDAVDALTENVPKEFQAPKVNDIRLGEFLIKDPQTGREIEVQSAEQRDAVLNAMRNGATLEQAAEIAKNAPVVTPDGLASATTSSTPKPAASAPAPAGSTLTFTDNRPAIIVPPTRPEGTNVGSMKGVIQGQAYDIEVIRAEDGKVYAVGTGENANHIFGEVKESSNKLLGDWRREGPWTPPPAKTQTAATPAATPGATPTAAAGTQPTAAQSSNIQIRLQIANSDRDHMTQKLFTDAFESGDQAEWQSTQ